MLNNVIKSQVKMFTLTRQKKKRQKYRLGGEAVAGQPGGSLQGCPLCLMSPDQERGWKGWCVYQLNYISRNYYIKLQEKQKQITGATVWVNCFTVVHLDLLLLQHLPQELVEYKTKIIKSQYWTYIHQADPETTSNDC